MSVSFIESDCGDDGVVQRVVLSFPVDYSLFETEEDWLIRHGLKREMVSIERTGRRYRVSGGVVYDVDIFAAHDTGDMTISWRRE